MIEIRKKGEHGLDLIIDGMVVSDENASGSIMFKNVFVKNPLIWQRISEHTFAELPQPIDDWHSPTATEGLALNENQDLAKTITRVVIGISQEATAPTVQINFYGNSDLKKWKYPWSPDEYATEIVNLAIQKGITTAFPGLPTDTPADKVFGPYGIQGMKIFFAITDLNCTIGEAVSKHLKIAEELDEEVATILAAKLYADSLVIKFDFPQSIKVACEQYLLFFAQFLQEVGIEANTDVQHETTSTLFSVTPRAGAEALDKIRRALEVYLDLPANPQMGQMLVYNGDIREQQLFANVQHLSGQLALANAMMQAKEAALQAKEATIQAHQVTIVEQQKLLNGKVLVDSIQYAATGEETEDKEAFFGGNFALTKYKGKGFEISTAGIYRWVRDLLLEPAPPKDQ